MVQKCRFSQGGWEIAGYPKKMPSAAACEAACVQPACAAWTYGIALPPAPAPAPAPAPPAKPCNGAKTPPPFAPFNSKNGREHRGKAALKKEMWFSQTSLSPARTIRAGHSARAILPAVNATGRALPSARPVRRASAQASTCMAGTCLVRTSR